MNILKSTVDSIIKNTLSNYFILSDKQKERISNKVIFKNMKINIKSINNLLYNLPIKIKTGKIEKLSIDYSIQIWKQPVKILLKGLILEFELDENFLDIELLKEKEIQKKFENFKNLILEFIQTKEYSKGFIEGLVTKIIDNLQIDIEDLKIIIFFNSVNKKPVFEIGFKSFSCHTKDEHDMDVFFDRENEIYKGLPILKKIELDKFYFKIFSGYKFMKIQKEKNLGGFKLAEKNADLLRLNQILIRIKIKTDDKNSREPQYTVNIGLERIELNLQQQYIVYFFDILKKFDKFSKKYENEMYLNLEKPEKKLILKKEGKNWNARKWWVYAIFSVIKQNFVKKRTSFFQEIFEEFNMEMKKEIHLNSTLMKIFADVINEGLEELYTTDFQDISIINKEDKAIDLKMILFLLPFTEIKKIIKLYCSEKINDLKKRNKQKSKLNSLFEFIGLKKKKRIRSNTKFFRKKCEKYRFKKK